jgi:hypothetical protein
MLTPMSGRKAGEDADQKRAALQKYISEQHLVPATWAKAAGMGESTLRNFFNGDSESLSDGTYEKLAKYESERRKILVSPAALRGQELVQAGSNSHAQIEREMTGTLQPSLTLPKSAAKLWE